MKQRFLIRFILCLTLCHLSIGDNRILSELSDTSTKWQFKQFSTQVEQHMETIVLPNEQLLFAQSQINQEGRKQVTLQKYQRDGTQIGSPLIFCSQHKECSRPKVILIDNIGFALAWIQIEQDSFFYIQIFNYELEAVTEQYVINSIHQEVHWDMVSEFHYMKFLGDTRLLIFYKPPNPAKIWSGLVFNYQDQSRTTEITIPHSKVLEIAINKISTIAVLQKLENSLVQVNILKTTGQISRSFLLNTSTNIRLAALSNNNFVVAFYNDDWCYMHVFDQRFYTAIQTNFHDYSTITPAAYYAKYQYSLPGGQIQLQALEDTLIIVGINKYDFQFRLVQVNNQLEFIQARQVHYENLNIYKYFIQKTNDHAIFVQWVDGLPETLYPEYKQTLYMSELNLKLTINQCNSHCDKCTDQLVCSRCEDQYQLINGKCQLKCINNCNTCSNKLSCDQCDDGYVFNNQFQCVEQINNLTYESRVSISDTTYKSGIKLRVMDNRHSIIIYKEYSNNEILQVKILDQNGVTEQSLQILVDGLINYDLGVYGEIIYIYILENSNQSTGRITLQKYASKDLTLLQRFQLPFLYSNMQYFCNNYNFFNVAQFETTFTIVVQGFKDSYYQEIFSQTYDLNGNLLNQVYYGGFNGENQFKNKLFDITFDQDLLYVLALTQCDLYLIIQDKYGGIIKQENQRIYDCYFLSNPSISKITQSNEVLISLQSINRQIYVFTWQNDFLYQTSINNVQFSQKLLALNSNSFILIYEEYHNEANYKVLKYIHFEDGSIKRSYPINQISVQPSEISIEYFDNYLFVAWTGYKNILDYSTNQVYLQSIKNDEIIGLKKVCSDNCNDCDNNYNCLTCDSEYELTSSDKCKKTCTLNCYYCDDVCKICNVGFILDNSKCTQTTQNQFVKLQENQNRLELNQQISISQSGYMVVSWLNYDLIDNRYRSYLKIFDQHGIQQDEQLLDVCKNPLQTQTTPMGEFTVLAMLCDDSILWITLYDKNFIQVLPWQGQISLVLENKIPQNNYFDISTNDINYIFVITQNRDQLGYYMKQIRMVYDQTVNDIKIDWISDQILDLQLIISLKLRVDANFIYYSFQYLQSNSDSGVNEMFTKKYKTDYNYNKIFEEIVYNYSSDEILNDSNTVTINKLQTSIDLKITSQGKQLFSISITSGMTIEDYSFTQFAQGFVIVWTQSEYAPDLYRTINAQVFYNNGTQITQLKQLASFSNQPSKPYIKSLKNGDFILIWSDIDSTGQSLFAARYNIFLSQIPLTSVICEQHCEVCLTSQSCQRCFDNYYLDGQTCKPQCSGSCTFCTIPYTCQICATGYYYEDNICKYDQHKIEEEQISIIQDISNTRVSITSFSDTSFVVGWNNNLSGVQSIFLQFYDKERKQFGNIKTLQGNNDRTYARLKSLANDNLAIIWFDGDCTVQCRLVLQIFDQNLQEQTTEILLALVTLPIIKKQSPVVINRQDNLLIIAYLSYENQKTTAYYVTYQIDNLLLLSTTQIENTDVQVDNLDIIVYNRDIYGIIYVVNNLQIKVISNRYGSINKLTVYENLNILETPTHTINQQTGNIALAWSEMILVNNQFMNKIMVLLVDSQFNQIVSAQKIETYHNEQLELPKLISKNWQDEISVFYKSSDSITQINQKLNCFNYNAADQVSTGYYRQLSFFSYEHNNFEIEQLQYQDYMLIDVGLNSYQQPTVFIMRVDGSGNQMQMGDVVCPQDCDKCLNDHSCEQCAAGYELLSGNYCQKQCPINTVTCELGQIICADGYILNQFQECSPLDPQKAQQLINTQQMNDQTKQNIATLTNYYQVVVWQSELQSLNGVSIYMQKFDPQFTKVGPEILITKNSIGVQQQPDITALDNNQFMVIWKDSNANNIIRILMQKFSFDLERIDNEIVVYDSTTSNLLQEAFIIYYESINYKVQALQNGNIAVLLSQSYQQQDESYVTDLRLKLFDNYFNEYSNQLIGQSSCCDISHSITSLNNIIYIIWKNQIGELRLIAINNDGTIINGLIINNQYNYSPTITKTELGQLVIGWANKNEATIQLYDQELNLIGDSYTIKLQTYIFSLKLQGLQGGIVATIQTRTETPQLWTESIYLQVFDNYLITTAQIQQINDYRGTISNIKSSSLGNKEFVVTWQQKLYNANSQDAKSVRDQDGYGLYSKRFDINGNILPISNIVCQTYCNKCSKDNLCESCQDGYYFDYTQSICQLRCHDYCQSCSNKDSQFGYCTQCYQGYAINSNGVCELIENSTGLEFYSIGDSSTTVFDQLTLQNGSIVVLYNQNECSQIFFNIIDNQGILIVNGQKLWSTGSGDSCELIKATALNNGHFAIIHRSFQTTQQNNIWLHVYDPNGIEIKSQVIVNYALWNYYYWWYQPAYNNNLLLIKSLSNGGFVIIYMNDNNGKSYFKPKIFMRFYSNSYIQISSDIFLKVDVIDNYSWDWLNQDSLSILETESYLIVSYNYRLQQWWNQGLKKIQITMIDKSDYSLINKIIDLELFNKEIFIWWFNDQQSLKLWQTETNKYLMVTPFPQGIIGTFFDFQFKVEKIKYIRLTQFSYWSTICTACCSNCWNPQSIKQLQLDQSFVITYQQQQCTYYQCSNIFKIIPISFTFEYLNQPKDIKVYLHNSFMSSQLSLIKKYQNNNILLMSVYQIENSNTINIMFNKFDSRINRLNTWVNCPESCLNCVNQNNIIKCLDCKNKYYLDENQVCQLTCAFDNCLQCGNDGTKSSYCLTCQEGYQIKDNSYCVETTPNQVFETEIAQNNHYYNSAPKVKTFSDGTILVIKLEYKSDIDTFSILGELLTKNGENIGEIVTLVQDKYMEQYEFDISSLDEIVLTWNVWDHPFQIKGQRFSKTLEKIGETFEIYNQDKQWLNTCFSIVKYLKDNTFGVLLYGGYCIYMKIYDSNLNSNEIFQMECFNWGTFDLIRSEQYQYYSTYDALYYIQPKIVSSSDFITILFPTDTQFKAKTFDYNFNLLSATTFKSNFPIQLSMAILENQNIIITWKDKLISWQWPIENREVIPSEQSMLFYVLTDQQLSFAQYFYFGMDDVKEEKPFVLGIPNGFSISWSGVNEKNSRYIDIRVALFDVSGKIQTGYISVSSKCSSPRNSQMASLRDGSSVIAWFQDNQIYLQKIDRFGVLQQLTSVICRQQCKKCQLENTCDICLEGYRLNNYGDCEQDCLIANCKYCSYWSQQCDLCESGYFADEQFKNCQVIDSTFQKKIAQSNINQQQPTVIISNNNIINLWISSDISSNYQLFGQTFTADGDQIIETKVIANLKNYYDRIQASFASQQNKIYIFISGYSNTQVLEIDTNLTVSKDPISLNFSSEFINRYYIDQMKFKLHANGFALAISGYKRKIINQFSTDPQVIVCKVNEIILYDFGGQMLVPPIILSTNTRPLNGFVDENNNCVNFYLKDILFSDQIYVLITDYSNPLEYCFIQSYDYSGNKLQEKNLRDLIELSYWDNTITLMKQLTGEIVIFGFNSKLIQLTQSFELISVEYLWLSEFYQNQLIQLINSQVSVISFQYQGQIHRYKLWIYDLNAHIIVQSTFISLSTTLQTSLSYITQNNGDMIFSWQEGSYESKDYGSIFIVRFNSQGQSIKFEQFSCLPHCNECKVASKCTVCSDGYHLDQQLSCSPTCSDNCSICSAPVTCDICVNGYYSDDHQQCQSKDGQAIEKLINSQVTYSQLHVRIAQFNDGSGVIVWQSEQQDGSGYGVYAQKIDSTGNEIGDEIRVSLNLKGSQYFPDVTILLNGNIIIIWVDGDIENVGTLYYQQFDYILNRIGVPTIIDNISVPWISYYDVPCVVQSLLGKQFAVIWISDSNGQQTIFVTVFDENGIRITTSLNNNDSNKEIVVSSNGMNFVIVYRQNEQLIGSLFDLNGQYLTDRIIALGSSPAITANQQGQYIIAWQSNGIIYYQLFDNQLNGQGQVFQTDQIDAFSDNPDIVAQSNGFAIVWQNIDQLIKRSRKIRLQLFDINGVPLKNSIEVDVETIYGQYPQLSLLNNDQIAVVWNAQNIDQDVEQGSGIYMMKFAADGIKESLSGITCPNRCQNCVSKNTCIKCVEDYVLLQNICIPQCADYCDSCSTPQSCDICTGGYKLDPSGYCSKITPDLMQEQPLLITPLLNLPSFSTSLEIDNSIIIYEGSIIYLDSTSYFQITITDGNTNIYSNQIPISTINIIHSDIIVREDNSIQIYWIENIISSIKIKVITLSMDFVVIEDQIIIDTIDIPSNGFFHTDTMVYIYYLNNQYFIIHSIYQSSNDFGVYQHLLSKIYQRLTQPIQILTLQHQINQNQIIFSNLGIIFVEYTNLQVLRTYQFLLDFTTVEMKETYFNSGFSDFANTFILKRLRNNGYVLIWRSTTKQSLSSINYIYYTLLDEQLNKVSDQYIISQSNGVLSNPIIIVQDNQFAVIWNNQMSIQYSQLSISYYDNYGKFIQTITQLNIISNNIKQYFVTGNSKIYINWISQITQDLIPKYQIYLLIIGNDGNFIPSPTLVCQPQCSTCNNKYTCLTCVNTYQMNSITKECDPLCPSQCTTCTTPVVCSECIAGYSLNNTQCEKNPCKIGCKRCNLLQQCLECDKNYYLNLEDTTECLGTCGPNCSVCNSPPKCDQCDVSFYWIQQELECGDISIAVNYTTIEAPLIATFPSGDYIAMWNQQGALSGIYFQLYQSNGSKIGNPTKVNNMDEVLKGRRLLQETSSSTYIEKTFFSDIAAFTKDFVVLWVDQTLGEMAVKIKKFDTLGVAQTKEITIGELPKQNLEIMTAPCLIRKTQDDNFVIGFQQQIESQIASEGQMFIQSFNGDLQPIGQMLTLNNTDVTKTPILSADTNGIISIVFTSDGVVYFTQISNTGDIIIDREDVSKDLKYRMTDLKNKEIVFLFEEISTNISPPVYILQFQIKNTDGLSEPFTVTQPQYGVQHPYVTSIGDGFIVAWRTVDRSLISKDIVFQIFDEFGQAITLQITVTRQGREPKNPTILILNDQKFYITWSGLSSNDIDTMYSQDFNICDILIDKNKCNQIIETPICTIQNCGHCDKSNICSACNQGYYVEQNICQIDCGSHCYNCTKPFECDTCHEEYKLTDSKICELALCEDGFKLNENNECIPYCSDNCAHCESFNTCILCEEQYILDQGKCYKEIFDVPLNNEEFPYYYIIIIVLGSVLLIGLLILSIWCYKKHKPNPQQRQVVVNQGQETYMNSVSQVRQFE